MDTVLKAASVYFIVLFFVRFSGRRTLSELTPFDMILLLIISETTQQAMLGEDYSLTNMFVLLLTLFAIDIVLSHLKRNFSPLANIIDGVPTVLISDGVPDERALRKSRISLEDVLVAAREQNGINDLNKIKFAVLEVSGKISIGSY